MRKYRKLDVFKPIIDELIIKIANGCCNFCFPFFFFFVPVFNPLKSAGALHFYMVFLLKCFGTF